MNNFQKTATVFLFTLGLSVHVMAQKKLDNWKNIVGNTNLDWFGSNEAQEIADNVLLYQRNIGGWPKNIQMQKVLTADEKQKLLILKSVPTSCTTDNGATTMEMLFLSKINVQHPDERYQLAFLNALNYLLKAQYDNGGWPQFYPTPKGYYSHITFNDDSMVNILEILKNIDDNPDCYGIKIPAKTLLKIKTALEKGIECIVKTQYKQNNVLTAWCAQHDEFTLLPAKARSYELPSLSGKESAKIVLFLMSIQNPSEQVIEAVNSAVVWFEKTKIIGIREQLQVDNKTLVTNKVIVRDLNAPPLWARFMELSNNKPFFCDRDGIKKETIAEIGAERRNGYAWYTNEPKEVLKKYSIWKKTHIVNVPKEKINSGTIDNNKSQTIVAQDGSGDYLTIQEAINNCNSFPYQRKIIFVKNGIYHEKVKIHEWNTNITLIGESKDLTIITYDDFFSKINLGKNSTFYTYTMLVEGDGFIAQNLTLKNSAGDVGQAIALSLNANEVIVSNCNILGNQDTLYLTGNGNKQYIKDCYIEGTTDFIFGMATVLFENCVIHSLKDSYITAAATPKGNTYGFVFNNCKLTADQNVKAVYLGRPWRIYAKTVFINCEMGKHIKPEGWHNWSKPEAEKTAFYAEYNSKIDSLDVKQRVPWSQQLKANVAKNYSKFNLLGTNQNKLEEQWYLTLSK